MSITEYALFDSEMYPMAWYGSKYNSGIKNGSLDQPSYHQMLSQLRNDDHL